MVGSRAGRHSVTAEHADKSPCADETRAAGPPLAAIRRAGAAGATAGRSPTLNALVP